MIKKLDKLVLKAFFAPFVLTFVVVVFILLTQTMLKYFEDLVGKNLGFSVFAELLFYFSLNTIPIALPLAVLLSSLMTFGNLGEHHELTAIKGSGISLLRVMRPMFIVAIFLSIGAFFFNNFIVPRANLRAYSLLYDITHAKTTFNIKEGTFYYGLPNYTIKVNKKMPDGKSIQDVMIYDHTDGRGNTKVILADSGKMYTIYDDRYLVLELFHGENYSEFINDKAKPQEFVRNKFGKSKLVFNMSSFNFSRTDINLFSSNKWMRNINELHSDIDSLNREKDYTTKGMRTNLPSYYAYTFRADTVKKANNIDLTKWIEKQKHYAEPQKHEILSLAAGQARNVRALSQSYSERITSNERDINVFTIEVFRKYTQAFACLAFFLIGAPLGAIIKKGGFGVPVLISIVFFIFFYVISITGEKWAKEGLVEVSYGMWTANVVLLMFGFMFLRQARNDSALFETDYYAVLFGKVKAIFARNKN